MHQTNHHSCGENKDGWKLSEIAEFLELDDDVLDKFKEQGSVHNISIVMECSTSSECEWHMCIAWISDVSCLPHSFHLGRLWYQCQVFRQVLGCHSADISCFLEEALDTVLNKIQVDQDSFRYIAKAVLEPLHTFHLKLGEKYLLICHEYITAFQVMEYWSKKLLGGVVITRQPGIGTWWL
jgi:hypothetical protein